MRKRTKRVNSNNIILNDVKANLGTYIIIVVLFIIGISIGVILTNRLSDNDKDTLTEYIDKTILTLKKDEEGLKNQIFKISIKKNIIIVLIIWGIGLTFFGKWLLYLISFIIGITFGYTTSALMMTFDLGQSILFFFSTIFLQNIIAIPTIIFLCVQGIKCHNDFLVEKKYYTNKNFIFKYTFYAAISAFLLMFSSIIERYISWNILYKSIKYL